MRRQHIQLLNAARQGDTAARCEVGRRYLRGERGFPRHVQTGMSYLERVAVDDLPRAASIVCENLPLEDLLEFRQERALRIAASSGSASAQFKLGVWLLLRHLDREGGMPLLADAAGSGHPQAGMALASLRASRDNEEEMLRFTIMTAAPDDLDGVRVARAGARESLKAGDLSSAFRCLRLSLALETMIARESADLVIAAIDLAERLDHACIALPPGSVQACLEGRCDHGDYSVAYTLGRALCGIPCGVVAPQSLVCAPNFRRGAALLLRSADGGCDEAWLHLYRLHSRGRSSVANPQMAKFFLEKASTAGKPEAQRELGLSLLREARSVCSVEQALELLSSAAGKGDDLAHQILKTLVIPLPGTDEEAEAVIASVRPKNPSLAFRLRLARDFGLTKLEASIADPARDARPWGLVVGHARCPGHRRLPLPRAIPALSDAIVARLQAACEYFSQAPSDRRIGSEAPRRGSHAPRPVTEYPDLDERMFFATASPADLNSLRGGPKWAFRVGNLIRNQGRSTSPAPLARPGTSTGMRASPIVP